MIRLPEIYDSPFDRLRQCDFVIQNHREGHLPSPTFKSP